MVVAGSYYEDLKTKTKTKTFPSNNFKVINKSILRHRFLSTLQTFGYIRFKIDCESYFGSPVNRHYANSTITYYFSGIQSAHMEGIKIQVAQVTAILAFSNFHSLFPHVNNT